MEDSGAVRPSVRLVAVGRHVPLFCECLFFSQPLGGVRSYQVGGGGRRKVLGGVDFSRFTNGQEARVAT